MGPDMSRAKPRGSTPKVTPEQAEAYKRGTPGLRRATLIALLAFWIVVVGAVLVTVLVFHETLRGGGMRI